MAKITLLRMRLAVNVYLAAFSLLMSSVYVCSSKPTKFEIPYIESDFQALKEHFQRTIYPDQLSDVSENDWSYGIPLEVVKHLAEYMQHNFSWAEQVAVLNYMPQYQINIDGHVIHFAHKRSSYAKAKPLMLIHGWPGSFWECHKIMPMLTEPQEFGGSREQAFHVVCPSIPGFGYSSKPTTKGFDQMSCAKLFAQLMTILGYDRYFLQGGDWGSMVATLQASLPESTKRVIGLHINMVPAPPPVKKGILAVGGLLMSVVVPWLFYSSTERQALMQVPLAALSHTGYFHQQSTQPQTLAYGLSDSPVGLLAWITEKFYMWGDCHGDLFSQFTADELLTNFMIYWTTRTAGG